MRWNDRRARQQTRISLIASTTYSESPGIGTRDRAACGQRGPVILFIYLFRAANFPARWFPRFPAPGRLVQRFFLQMSSPALQRKIWIPLTCLQNGSMSPFVSPGADMYAYIVLPGVHTPCGWPLPPPSRIPPSLSSTILSPAPILTPRLRLRPRPTYYGAYPQPPPSGTGVSIGTGGPRRAPYDEVVWREHLRGVAFTYN